MELQKIEFGYEIKLTSIGDGKWQLFLTKINESSDFVRAAYGVTEQVGGGNRTFKILRRYILTPQTDSDPVFMLQLDEMTMKNRRVWIALETVKRQKGKRGIGTGTFIALSPVQSKWRKSIGSTTGFEIKQLAVLHFDALYSGDKELKQQEYKQIEA